ncbi:alpha/beta hydrolase [Myxococcota bacterium]|nr:alpha/beta hydrolase [Myxococcota bacterium]
MPAALAHHLVSVDGGDLQVGVWPAADPKAPSVIAIHGGTSSHRIWSAVARALAGRVRLITPDYRGANGSEAVGPPYGLLAHAEDVERVADHFGVERPLLAGWSLGGFIAANAAERLGTRVKGSVLVDGGLPLPLPEDFDPAAVQDALIEPAMRRYRMRFSNRDEHRAVWRSHPSLQDASLWTPDLALAIDDELEESGSGLRFRVNLESLRYDVLDTLRAQTRTAVSRLASPATFVWAERGLEDEPVGYYPLETARALTREYGLRLAEGRGLNHYALMLAERGARMVADALVGHL